MKFLGVAVAFLVLAVSLEYANADCKSSYYRDDDVRVYYSDQFGFVDYQAAVARCSSDDAELLTERLASFLGNKYGWGLFWVQSDPSDGMCNTIGMDDYLIEPAPCTVEWYDAICYCEADETTTPAPTTIPSFQDLVEGSICGDPVVGTYDGAVISLVQPGMYLASTYWPDDSDPCRFRASVFLQTENNGNFDTYFIHGASVVIGDLTYHIYDDYLYVEGQEWIELDCQANKYADVRESGGVKIYAYYDDNCCLVLAVPACDMWFRWCPRGDKYHCFTIGLGNRFAGQTTGMLGNFNGNEEDDYNTSAGNWVGDQRDRNILISESYATQGTMPSIPTIPTMS